MPDISGDISAEGGLYQRMLSRCHFLCLLGGLISSFLLKGGGGW